MARLCPLFSGSSGNSYYIGSRSAGVLLDIGRSARQTEQMLLRCGIDPLALGGILITHEHTDHISGAKVFAKKYHLPVFASKGTCEALRPGLDGVQLCPVQGELELAGMTVHPFHTSHDCVDPLGFRIDTQDGRCFALATDLGYLSEEVKQNLLGADLVVLESNHDLERLRCGSYPYYLKRRILSSTGHLSNDACSAFLPSLIESGTKRVLLAHLSRENNTPLLAYNSALSALSAAGYTNEVDFLLDTVKPENEEGKTIVF